MPRGPMLECATAKLQKRAIHQRSMSVGTRCHSSYFATLVSSRTAGGDMPKHPDVTLKAIGRCLRCQSDHLLTNPPPPQISKLLSRLRMSEGVGANDGVRAWVLAQPYERGPRQDRPGCTPIA